MSRAMARTLFIVLLLAIAGLPAMAQETSAPAGAGQAPPVGAPAAPSAGAAPQPAAAAEAPPALVDNPLGEIPPDEPRMEAYSHGHYILYFLSSFWDMAVLALLVITGFGATLQAWAERVTRRPNLKVAVYTVLFTVVTIAASFPLTAYGGFVREKKYGFATQTFPAWLGDQGKALLVATILQTLFFVLFYLAIRRLGRRWWIAGWVLCVLSLIFVQAIAPVFIAPLFNTFKPLENAGLRSEILEMAHRAGIPAHEVYEVDASRQSTHNDAYVAGLLGTQRIVLYDTLLKKFTPREIKFVMGHEMGHYVLNHIWKFVGFLSVLFFLGLYLLDRVTRRIIERRPKLKIGALAEPASLPLLSLVLSVLVFVSNPAINTFSRTEEHEADLFGLEATHDPVAAASVFLKFGRLDLGEYHVHPLIEALLFTHPSLARRIETAQEYARQHGVSAGESPAGTTGR